MNVREQLAKILQVEATLPHEKIIYLISTEKHEESGGRAGIVADIPDRRQAAKLIVEGWFRLATPEERASFHADLGERTQATLAAERMRKTESRLVLSPELLQQIGSK